MWCTHPKRQKGDVEQNEQQQQQQQLCYDIKHDDIAMTSVHNDDGNYEDIGNRLLSPFGQDHIHEIKGGNSKFARGTFGELSIAIQSRSRGHNQLSTTVQSTTMYSFVAVKKIHNALTNSGSGHLFGRSLQSRQQLSNEVLNELLAVRLLHGLQHPNIATMVAVYPNTGAGNQGSLSLVFPYCLWLVVQ